MRGGWVVVAPYCFRAGDARLFVGAGNGYARGLEVCVRLCFFIVCAGVAACGGEATVSKSAPAPVDADGDGVAADLDCDDENPLVFPGQVEHCDGVDEDCDGMIDDDAVDSVAYFPDEDSDGFGGDAGAVASCTTVPDWLTTGGDCDDADPFVHPDMPEVPCNGIPESCSGDGGVRVPEDVASLQLAVDAAPEGGFVCVGPGTWDGAFIARSVQLVAVDGPDVTFLDGGGRANVLDVDGASGTTIDGFSIRNGDATVGGGVRIRNATDVTVRSCRFDDNVARAHGGAVSIESSSNVLVTTSFFDDNAADGAGGAVYVDQSTDVRISECQFNRNLSQDDGGSVALSASQDIRIAGGAMARGAAQHGGCLASQDVSGLTVEVVSFSSCSASVSGGAVWLTQNEDVVVSEVQFSGNTSENGAAMTVWDSGSVAIDASRFLAHRVDQFGACLLLRAGAFVDVSNTTFDSCSAGIAGGAIAVRETSSLTVSDGLFDSGFGGVGGGIALVDAGVVSVSGASFVDNRADTEGAGLYAASGSLHAVGVTFSGNLPDDWACAGAAACSVAEAP